MANRNVDDIECAIRRYYTDQEFRLLVTRLKAGLRAVDDLRNRLPADLFKRLGVMSLPIDDLDGDERQALTWLFRRLSGEEPDEELPTVLIPRQLKLVPGTHRKGTKWN